MSLKFNLSRFAWVAVLVFLLALLPQSALAQKNYGFSGSFHVGSTYPLSDLNTTSDSNIHFRFDLSFRYQFSHDKIALAIVGFYGFNQFTEDHFSGADNMYWRNLSLNAKLIFNVTPNYYLYLQAGPGSYKPKVGANCTGYNLGAGFQVPMGSASRLEFGVDYHTINTPSTGEEKIKTKFLTLQLGVIFPLF